MDILLANPRGFCAGVDRAIEIVKRALDTLGAPIYVPPPDEGDPEPVDGQVFNAGDRLLVGVEAFPGMEPNDLMLWVESRRALVAGDTLVDSAPSPEEAVMTAETASGMRYAFHDARAQLGHLLEVYEPSPGVLRLYDKVADAAVGWDGGDPVREW